MTSNPKPRRPAVSVALLRENRLLLVLRGRAPSRGLYAFPGGHVEPGESLEAAALRELAEETGLICATVEPLVNLQIGGDEAGYDLQVYKALYAEGEVKAASDADAAAFFTLAEMEQLPVLDSVLEVARALLGNGNPRELAI